MQHFTRHIHMEKITIYKSWGLKAQKDTAHLQNTRPEFRPKFANIKHKAPFSRRNQKFKIQNLKPQRNRANNNGVEIRYEGILQANEEKWRNRKANTFKIIIGCYYYKQVGNSKASTCSRLEHHPVSGAHLSWISWSASW